MSTPPTPTPESTLAAILRAVQANASETDRAKIEKAFKASSEDVIGHLRMLMASASSNGGKCPTWKEYFTSHSAPRILIEGAPVKDEKAWWAKTKEGRDAISEAFHEVFGADVKVEFTDSGNIKIPTKGAGSDVKQTEGKSKGKKWTAAALIAKAWSKLSGKAKSAITAKHEAAKEAFAEALGAWQEKNTTSYSAFRIKIAQWTMDNKVPDDMKPPMPISSAYKALIKARAEAADEKAPETAELAKMWKAHSEAVKAGDKTAVALQEKLVAAFHKKALPIARRLQSYALDHLAMYQRAFNVPQWVKDALSGASAQQVCESAMKAQTASASEDGEEEMEISDVEEEETPSGKAKSSGKGGSAASAAASASKSGAKARTRVVMDSDEETA